MALQTTLRQAGGSISAILPKSLVDRYKLKVGEKVFLRETDEGVLITPYDPDVSEALEITANMSRTYRNALRELAK